MHDLILHVPKNIKHKNSADSPCSIKIDLNKKKFAVMIKKIKGRKETFPSYGLIFIITGILDFPIMHTKSDDNFLFRYREKIFHFFLIRSSRVRESEKLNQEKLKINCKRILKMLSLDTEAISSRFCIQVNIFLLFKDVLKNFSLLSCLKIKEEKIFIIIKPLTTVAAV